MAGFTPNDAGIRALGSSPGMVRAMDRTAQRIVTYAKLTGPYDTGRYSRSWRITSGVRGGVAWARIVNVATYAGYLEFGTRHMKRQRILGKALSAARR
jgi:HK97 gp10 family phage protein